MNVETDHQPLETIMKKPLDSAPKRLQGMLLRLQKYDLRVKYKKGRHMYIADTLSRAYLDQVHTCHSVTDLEGIDHTRSLSLTDERLQQFVHISADDPVLQELRKIILQGWPETKSEVPEFLHAYYDFRDELTVQDQLVFKGPRLVVPAPLRKEMMAEAHATHIGVEGCVRRARDTMYWPRMVTELKEYISRCDICTAHRDTPSKEPLQQHNFVARPWSRVGADLCDLRGRTLLVVSDYFSNFIEVENTHKVTTNGVSKALKAMFARYGVPDELVTDNGPQFASAEFVKFARVWGFKHVTSSPYYPQSNGRAENAVKTVKRLFTKCHEAGQSEYRALLDWRNTPSEGIGTSPAQRFFCRHCKTLLPTTQILLEPRFSTEKDMQALRGQKERQCHYYNQHTRTRPPIAPGESVQMRLPGDKTWSPGVCLGLVGPRSYRVLVGGRAFRRNRRQLICAKENPPKDLSETRPSSQPAVPSPSQPASEPQVAADHHSQPDCSPPKEISKEAETSQELPDPAPMPLRRSERTRKSPMWITQYVPS